MSNDQRVRWARGSARKAARLKEIFFDLPPSADLPRIPERCPICSRVLTEGGSRKDSASLDRLLPNLGYTLQNVWWICHDCNRQKADLDPARAYALWDRVWEEIKRRGLPLPTTRLKPSIHVRSGEPSVRPGRTGADEGGQAASASRQPKQGEQDE